VNKNNNNSFDVGAPEESKLSAEKEENNHIVKSQRHILYIQMQLSKETLLDYFRSREQSADGVDIPLSLRIFTHIARGVMYVHEKGLIHRDLKPSNCFMDDSEYVKIGDFGLSRESGAKYDEKEDSDATQIQYHSSGQDNTAGVGTQSYASPEQLNGKNYDSSSDVYSLGIILFELCYPMKTGMERFMVFRGIKSREQVFPPEWHSTVAQQFPTVHRLLFSMLSHTPSKRPSAEEVVDHIESLLGEYTVLSLDRTSYQEGYILLRIESEDNEGVLPRTIKLIKDSSKFVKIVQYSLRGQDTKAIMEFALNIQGSESQRVDRMDWIVRALNESNEISVVRQINEEKASADLNASRRTLSM